MNDLTRMIEWAESGPTVRLLFTTEEYREYANRFPSSWYATHRGGYYMIDTHIPRADDETEKMNAYDDDESDYSEEEPE